MSFFGIGGSPQAVLANAPDSWVSIQTLRGIGANRTRIFVDTLGNLKGQFENNPPQLIAGLGTTSETAVNTVPVGAIFQWLTSTAPTGYLMCDGRSAGAYPQLAALLNAYGGNTPNFGGRVIVGAGDRDYTEPWPGALAVGAKGGSVRKQLKPEHMPRHSHTIAEETAGNHDHTVTIPAHSHSVSGYVASHAHSIDVITTDAYDVSDETALNLGDGIVVTTDATDIDLDTEATELTSADISASETGVDNMTISDTFFYGNVYYSQDGFSSSYATFVRTWDTSADMSLAHTHTIPAMDINGTSHEHVINDGTITLESDLGETGNLRHVHNIDENTSTSTPAFFGDSDDLAEQTITSSSAGGNHSHGGRTGGEGSSFPEELEVIQPWIAMNYIIKHD
jgi:microcystin-dependent protein